ncbi:MAG: polysaccharide biosynthesis C-terminal domain-containing protein, partial [Candidatus Omnitrophica bacterium]|nr:polysaccharide biosynthesis C-terminal domain-containing protein [Candidatus Omnitrophota bacterium]
ASVLVDTMLASLAFIVGEGGVAALYYASRLVQLPLGIFGISVAQAALPTLSQQASLQDMDSFKATLLSALRATLVITIPASVGLVLLGRPIVETLFQRGEFTAYSSEITSFALMFYAFGLWAFAWNKILVAAFHSMKDTRTPVKAGAAALGANIALNLILMWPLGIGGLALATACSSTLSCVLLMRWLGVRLQGLNFAQALRVPLMRVGAATLLMAVFCVATAEKPLFFSIGGSIVLYGVGCVLLNVEEVKVLTRKWRRT